MRTMPRSSKSSSVMIPRPNQRTPRRRRLPRSSTQRRSDRALAICSSSAMGLGRKDDELYVSTGASHMLVALHPMTLEERERWELPREPRAVLVSRDGARVFVSHAAESVLSIVEKGKREPRAQKVGNTEGC